MLPGQETWRLLLYGALRGDFGGMDSVRAEEDSIAAKDSDMRPAISGAAMTVVLPHY